MKRFRLRKMSWDPRSILYLTQLPLHVNSYVKGEQPYESFGSKESAYYSCPDLLEAIDEEGKQIRNIKLAPKL